MAKIIDLRQNDHFGPQKIAMDLARDHDITISPSGARRILTRRQMGRPPASQRDVCHNKCSEALCDAAAGPPGLS